MTCQERVTLKDTSAWGPFQQNPTIICEKTQNHTGVHHGYWDEGSLELEWTQ